jgi:hypothetical protein
MADLPRKTPCASCPYRRDVPSGVWDASEYEKLPRYDGDPAFQNPRAFDCHQADGHLCAGWLGHRDPYDLLAVRIGILHGTIDPACVDYTTDVPLFASGAEAAAHGMREIAHPGPKARTTIDKVLRRREVP